MTLTIGLLTHSLNSDNLGVGALSVAHLAILKEAAAAQGREVRFVLAAWSDPKPPYFTRADIEVVPMRLRDYADPRGLFSLLRRCDLVLDIGAGDSFSDIYGARRVAKMLAAQQLALFARRPLVLSPQTIGPFKRKWVARVALNVMRRARLIAARDRLSADCAREMGVSGPLIEASDVALRLPYRQPERGDTAGPVKVGINVSGLLFNGGYSQDNMFSLAVDYGALMDAVVARFHRRQDCEVHLIGHVLSQSQPVEDDHAACLALAERFPGCKVAPVFTDPSAAKSYIAAMDFFTGARMHACIAALSSGVPVLPMAYSRKFAGLFGALGYAHGVDCKSDDQATILARLDQAFVEREVLASDAEAALAVGLERLGRYEQALRQLFAELPERGS
ncbi:MAG: polysaccharide pyruvyl transferase family protein [Rhodospirillales bacterium]